MFNIGEDNIVNINLNIYNVLQLWLIITHYDYLFN